MFRSLIIIAAIVLVFLLVKNRLSAKSPVKQGTSRSNDTVKCLQCNTYIPDKEAVKSGDKYFCCKQHLRDWEENQSRNT